MSLRRFLSTLLAFAPLVSLTSGAQLPLRDPDLNGAFVGDKPPQLLDDSFDAWLHDLASEWGMKGLSIAVVRRKSDGDWDVETKGYGVKNTAGDPVTEDVSALNSA